jgi:hypothetical protein
MSIDLLESSKDFQDTLNVIFIEKLPETIFVASGNWDSVLKMILALALIIGSLVAGFFIIIYTLLML